MKLLNSAQQYLLNRPPFRVLMNRAAGLLVFSTVLAVLAELFTTVPSRGASLPVIDATAASQRMQQIVQQAESLIKMAEEIVVLKQQVQSLTGHYGMGSLGPPLNAWGQSSWDDIVAMVNTGVNPGDAAQVAAFKAAHAKIVGRFPAINSALQTTNPRMSAVFATSYQAGVTGMSAGEGTFNSLQTDLAELQVLKEKIDRTDNVKAALDLNTAVAVKTAQINAEILRNNAMQLYLQGNAQNAQAGGQAAEAEFFAN